MAKGERDWILYKAVCEEAAIHFLDECSIQPTPEAVSQLIEAFLPCLALISSRGYDPNGANWRKMGWRGLLVEINKRWERIHYLCWQRGKIDPNNVPDAINYLAYFHRLSNEGDTGWGTIGKPGPE